MFRSFSAAGFVLFTTSVALAGYQLRLETSGGNDTFEFQSAAESPQSLALNIVLSSDGQPDEFGSTQYLGGVLRLAPDARLALSGLALNAADFDADVTPPNTSDPLQVFGIAADGRVLGPYADKRVLATVVVTLPAFTPIPQEGLRIQTADVFVMNDQFIDVPAAASTFVITPEPAAALLLALGAPFMLRRRRPHRA